MSAFDVNVDVTNEFSKSVVGKFQSSECGMTLDRTQTGQPLTSLREEARRARANGNRDAELTALYAIDRRQDGQSQKQKLALGNALIVHEMYAEVETVLQQIEDVDASGDAFRLLKTQLICSRGEADGLISDLNNWVTAETNPAKLIPIIESAWIFTGDPSFLQILKRVCDLCPSDLSAIAFGGLYHLIDLNERKNISFELSPRNIGLAGRLIEAYLDQGLLHQARSIADRAVSLLTDGADVPNPHAHQFKVLRQLCDVWIEPSRLPRSLIQEDFFKDVIISEPVSSNKLAVVFAGWNGRPLGGSRILDNQLASLGYQSIFIRDSNSVGYGKGIRSLGPDRRSSIQTLKSIIDKSGATDIVFIGASIGTFGAISHGLPMGIEKFALFGPVTSAGNRAFLHSLGDYRGGVLLNRTSRMISKDDQLMSSFIQRASHEFKIKAIIGDMYDLDNRYAQSISDFEQVEVHEIENCNEHNSLFASIRKGVFANQLEYS